MNKFLRDELVVKLCYLASEHKEGLHITLIRDEMNKLIMEYLEKARK